MRLTLIALAAALVAVTAPAAACDVFACASRAVGDDIYPPGEPRLPPSVTALVDARDGKGLSLAGFYNDPALALAPRHVASADYGYAPAAPVYVEEPPAPVDYGYRMHHHRHGPHVIVSPYGRSHHVY